MKPRILHVVRGMSNSSGTTHIVRAMTEELAKLGCDVTLFHVEKRGQGEPVEPARELVRSESFPLSLPFANPGISREYGRAIRRRIREFDLVHIHAIWNYPTWSTMREARNAGVPFVVAPQGSLDGWALNYNAWRKGFYAKKVERPLFNRAAAMQALTLNERQQIRRFGVRSPVAIIPNGVDEEMLESRGDGTRFRVKHNVPEGHRVLLFLARLHPKKGLDNLADAWGEAARDLNGVTLVVAGNDGGFGYEETAREHFRKAGVADRTIFTGEVRGEEKRDAFAAADAYVLSSYSEGQPMSVIEAMASALPVIATPGCNIPEITEHGAGCIVKPEGREVARAIREVFAEDGKCREMGGRGRALVRERFTWPKIARRTLRVYEKILSGRNGR